jgi:hypothetical protein
MTCCYTKKSVNGTMQNIPEFERTPRDSPTTNYMGIFVVSLAIIINEREYDKKRWSKNRKSQTVLDNKDIIEYNSPYRKG